MSEMSQPKIKYLNKANNLITIFNDSINKNNANDAFNVLYKLRKLHGKLISKIIKSSKNYFFISSLYSIVNLINDKIIESEQTFENYIKKNNIDVKKLQINKSAKSTKSTKSTNSESSVSSDSEQLTLTDQLTSSDQSLPLFEGEKSAEARQRDGINLEMNKHIVEFNQSIPSLLLFYNPRCPACIKTKPHWESLTTQIKNSFAKKNNTLFNIMEIDLSDPSNENLAGLFQIEYIPTIIMMESSKKPMAKIEKIEGLADKEKINSFIKTSYDKFSS
jgi:thiol-disulfide isomerase/thioredoxin